MSIQLTYDSLVSSLKNYIEEQDEEFLAVLDLIISLAEIRVTRDLNLELHNSDVSSTAVDNTTRIFTIPTTIVEVVDAYNPSTGVSLEARAISFVREMGLSLPSSKPSYWVRIAQDKVLFAPKFSGPAVNYSFRCEVIPEHLSPTVASTFLSYQQGDLLFLACLIECEKYNKNGKVQAEREAEYFRLLQTKQGHSIHSVAKRYSPFTAAPEVAPKVPLKPGTSM